MLKSIAKACVVSVFLLVGETDLRIYQADYLEEKWPEFINVLRKEDKKLTLEECRRIA